MVFFLVLEDTKGQIMKGFKGSHSTPQTKEKQFTMCERDQAEAQEHQNTTVRTKTEFQLCQDMPQSPLIRGKLLSPHPVNTEKAFPAQVSQEASIKSQNSHWSEI